MANLLGLLSVCILITFPSWAPRSSEAVDLNLQKLANSTNNSTKPTLDPPTFNVRNYGAVGNGSSNDTQAFQLAWNAACAVNSSVLLVPSDGVFMIHYTAFSGPCQPGLVFQVDGVLMPPDGPDQWPESDSKQKWLVFYNVSGMTLKGKGLIKGNGEKWWTLPCKPNRGPNGTTLPGPCDSPVLVFFYGGTDISLLGLRIESSPQFHVKFDHCERVLVESLSISSPASSPNTDGIHIGNSNSVSISKSTIAAGDDCISIGANSRDIDINNVTCGPSHGISIGSLGAESDPRACVTNVTVRNAVIRESENGVRIKTWQGGAGSVSGVRFDGVLVENTASCIVIDQFYCPNVAGGCANKTSAVQVTGVTFANIKGTYDAKRAPVRLACSDVAPCTNITVAEVELRPHRAEVGAVGEPFCWNAYGVMEASTVVPAISCLREGDPLTAQEDTDLGCSS